MDTLNGSEYIRLVTGIIIDPWSQTVKAKNFAHSIKNINKLIGSHTFDVLTINEQGDGIFIDDNGLYADLKCPWIIETDWGKQALVNKGLVLGSNSKGQSIAPKESIDKIKERISFGEKAFQGFLKEDVFPAYKVKDGKLERAEDDS